MTTTEAAESGVRAAAGVGRQGRQGRLLAQRQAGSDAQYRDVLARRGRVPAARRLPRLDDPARLVARVSQPDRAWRRSSAPSSTSSARTMPKNGAAAQHDSSLHAQRGRADGLHAGDVQRREVPAHRRPTPTSWRCRWSSNRPSSTSPTASSRTAAFRTPRRQFLKDVPAAWDDTRAIAGTPGRAVLVARRAGAVWYVAGISGQDAADVMKLPLGFLGAGAWQLTLIRDGADDRTFDASTRPATARDTIEVQVRAHGGFVGRLVKSPAAR